MKRLANQPNPPNTRDTIRDVRAAIPQTSRISHPHETLTPGLGRLYRRYQENARVRVGDGLLNRPPNDIEIPQNLLPITIFDGFVNGRRLIVFLPDTGRRLLQRFSSNVCIDGTFKVG